MKNFKLLKNDVDVASFMQELREYQKPWSSERARLIPFHRDTLSIFLRAPVMENGEPAYDAQKERETLEYALFPKLTEFLEHFANEVQGSLARVIIVSLKPDSKVYPHTDGGTYYQKRDRYHLILQSPDGSRMVSGDEDCTWQEGELWWFDNKSMHQAFNPSKKGERIHVIFDILPQHSEQTEGLNR